MMALIKLIPDCREQMMTEMDMDKDMIHSVNLEADKDYVSRTLTGSIVIFLLLIIAGSISNISVDSPLLFYTIVFCSFISIVLHFFLLKTISCQTSKTIKRWEIYFSMVALSTAIYWGVFSSWNLIQYGISDVTLVYLLFSVGIGSGAAASNFIWKKVAQLYLAIILLPPIVILMAVEEGNIVWALSASFVIYFLFLYIQVVRANNEYWKALINTKQLLIQAEELEKASRAKSEFLSVMSHELRTPLTSIKGALGLLSSDELDLSPEEVKKMLNVAYENTNHLTFLVNDILDFEKLESGKTYLNKEIVQLPELIRHAIQVNQGYAEKYKVGFLFNDNNCGNIKVNADRNRLLQVISNLLSNAIKYSPQGDIVEVQLSCIGEKVRVTVIDNGKGVPINFYQNIFNRFSQADSADTREKGGTGLGLAISKEIIEQHNGYIGFDSEEGKGTRFYFELATL